MTGAYNEILSWCVILHTTPFVSWFTRSLLGQAALWAVELRCAETADSEKSISTGLKRNPNVTFTPQKPPSGFFSLGGHFVSTLITHSIVLLCEQQPSGAPVSLRNALYNVVESVTNEAPCIFKRDHLSVTIERF